MARTAKDSTVRRTEILDAAQRLVYTKGYEQMTIQDILDTLQISKGAFYHYFDSKNALLEALIERIADQVELVLAPIVQDPGLTAAEKLQRVYNAAARWKTDRKEYLLTLVNVWYTDKNAILRQKVQTAVLPRFTHVLATVISQGVEEGVFHTAHFEHASEIFFVLVQSFGENLIKPILHPGQQPEALQHLEAISAAYQDAVERVLGAATGSLPLFDTGILKEWLPPPAPNAGKEHPPPH